MTMTSITSALLGLVMGASAFGATDYIIRMEKPINNKAQTDELLLDAGAGNTAQAQIINGEEGLLNVRFENEQAAQKVLDQLEQSGTVAHISENHLYKPTMNYEWVDVTEKSSDTSMVFPFFNKNGLPGVQLPPANFRQGADPLIGNDWGIHKVGLVDIGSNQTNSSIITAVLDTGMDYNHEDLIAKMWRHPDNAQIVGRDFAQNVDQPYDVVHFDIDGCMRDFLCAIGINQQKYLVNPGHGTHVAGHVAAFANNSLGIQGVGAGAKVMALKFFYDYGSKYAGQGSDAGAIQGIDYAIKYGVKVINASWGGQMAPSDWETSELKQAFVRAQQAGVIIVVAAGNDGKDNDAQAKPIYPAKCNLDNLIVVAATDSNDGMAKFSTYGNQSVHIGAPGDTILSTVVGNGYTDTVAEVQGKKIPWSGTSMAAPYAAGAVARIWSAHPNESYKQIRERIFKTVRQVPALAGKTTTGGIINVQAAIDFKLTAAN